MEALRERFGKYHVLGKLAQGGMAEVYKVKTVGIAGFEKVQALKRILPASAREGRFIRSFIDEARIAVELTHRNIVQVFDFGKADGELFLAMELIEGKDLRTAMNAASQRELPALPEVAAYVVSEIAHGLDYAHRKTDVSGGPLGIVHCDVSPANVMLSSDGYVKILDFGIARATFSAALERKRLRGKPRYMAPEQTHGEPPTAAADVFALGIIAWELFTGRGLFRGADLNAILEAVRTLTPPRIDAIVSVVPREIVDAVATALARDPEQRGTAADLAAACARTALLGGARALSEWLAELEQRTSAAGIAWADVTSVSAPPVPEQARELTIDSLPPARPSVTLILEGEPTAHNAPPFTEASLDEPEIVFIEAEPASEPSLEAEPEAEIDDDLGAITGSVPAERRRTVIVAAVLRGAAPEATRGVTRSLGELAYQRGGVVIALDDDALVVAFGLEVVGEDDAAIAVGWALDGASIVRDVCGEGAALHAAARTGVATMADGTGAPEVPEDAIDDVRALAREAAPGRPLLAGTAGRLIGGSYTLRAAAVPPRRQRSGRVLEVVAPRGFEERGARGLPRRGALFGRGPQLAELVRWFAQAGVVERRLAVVVRGAEGTGKSRLVAELLASVEKANPRVVVATASPAGRTAPFALIIDVYQAALRLPPLRGVAARKALRERLLALLGAEAARALATDLDRAMELRDGLVIGDGDDADLRPRIAAGLGAFRTAMRERGRTLITVVEDAHHADSASLDVIGLALAEPAPGPELFVLAARPDTRLGPAITERCDVAIALGDLVGSELRAMIADRLGPAATPMQVAAVLARAGGNPLFVEELAQAVREAGADDDDVPASARELVLARLERLSPLARTSARLAAVFGGRVRVRLLEELLAADPAGDELVASGLFVRQSDRGEDELAFARGLVREVVYESQPTALRRDHHAQVGRLLAARFFAGRPEAPGAIAEHLEHGGELAGAAAFWLRAGRVALAAADRAAAAQCFERTLRLERELGEPPPTPASAARRREAARRLTLEASQPAR